MPPDVPTPAPAKISPVAFSSTNIFIIFDLSKLPEITSLVTFLKKFRLLILLIDFACNISLKISPSSISNLFLMTSSRVILFPNILIFSMVNFSVSLILNFKLI